MSLSERRIRFSDAINEAFHQIMAENDSVFIIGQGLESPWYVGNTATGLIERFGANRVIDTPVSENGITGVAVGAAISGMKPVVVHPRVDFMLYALDPIINEAANWYYMNGGKANVPAVFWGCINRGGEQAAQHSQALQALFAHIPGLKVVMPATPFDAKGLMISAIKEHNPVVFIDDRWLHNIEGHVPDSIFEVPIGKAALIRQGKDLTLVSSSYITHIAVNACERLSEFGIEVELIDLRTIKPYDKDLILKSVRKTGHLVVADGSWKNFGVAAEILAMVVESSFGCLKKGPLRLCLPDCPAPASRTLEKSYYLSESDIVDQVLMMMRRK